MCRQLFRVWRSCCLVFVAVGVGSVWGQEPAEEQRAAGEAKVEVTSEGPEAGTTPKSDVDKTGEEPKKEAEKVEPRVGFLGDTSRFTRAGGWGSLGGAMGQWGVAKSMLVMLPPVQEELALTDEQKQQLKDWNQQMRTRGEEWGRGLREQEGGDPFAQQNVPITARMQQFMGFMSQVSVLLKENEAGVSRILDSDQRRRLGQISYQMEGVGALLRPEVMRAVNLSPSQQIRINQVIARSRTVQMTTWMTQMMSMSAQRDNRQPGGPQQGGRVPPQAPGGASAKRVPPATGPAGENTPRLTDEQRAERAIAFQKQFETTRNRNDELQEQTAIEVIKVLTARQRKTFDKILGEPFDPAKVNTMGRPEGRRRQEAAPREAELEEETTKPIAPRP